MRLGFELGLFFFFFSFFRPRERTCLTAGYGRASSERLVLLILHLRLLRPLLPLLPPLHSSQYSGCGDVGVPGERAGDLRAIDLNIKPAVGGIEACCICHGEIWAKARGQVPGAFIEIERERASRKGHD